MIGTHARLPHDAHLVQQVSASDELLHNEEAARVLLVVVIVLANAVARRNVPVGHGHMMRGSG